ncbi:hypothetical protein H8958_012670, partial [Nasalis larvatus]
KWSQRRGHHYPPPATSTMSVRWSTGGVTITFCQSRLHHVYSECKMVHRRGHHYPLPATSTMSVRWSTSEATIYSASHVYNECKMVHRQEEEKVSSTEGAAKEEPKRGWVLLSAKPPAKVEAKPKKAAVKDKSSDKKVQTKGKKGAKGKQAEVANQETEEDLPAENGEMKTEESPASDEAGEKEATSD